MTDDALCWLVGVTLIVCAAVDVRARLIPDLVTLPAMGLALAVRALEGPGDLNGGLLAGLLGAAVGGGVFAAFALVGRGLGWGDVKLMAAVGAGLGLQLAVAALLFTSLAGAVQVVVSELWFARTNSDQSKRHIPYGLAIAVGSAWAMWWGRGNLLFR